LWTQQAGWAWYRVKSPWNGGVEKKIIWGQAL
jgi:hypothetical protein